MDFEETIWLISIPVKRCLGVSGLFSTSRSISENTQYSSLDLRNLPSLQEIQLVKFSTVHSIRQNIHDLSEHDHDQNIPPASVTSKYGKVSDCDLVYWRELWLLQVHSQGSGYPGHQIHLIWALGFFSFFLWHELLLVPLSKTKVTRLLWAWSTSKDHLSLCLLELLEANAKIFTL